MLSTYILFVYIFQVGVNQQLYGRTCWCGMPHLRAGAAVKFYRGELDS